MSASKYDQTGQLVQETVTQESGFYLQSNYAPDGALTSQTTGHADGSRGLRRLRHVTQPAAPGRNAF
ncbi:MULTISPECIES: hypothetical protein [unclassified Bradyrhizobium]|uniref:hypothetical protein n=1 Tax=unclassified Bradyrhizobium TaxID=2631580 RepID=UPI002FF2B854